MANDELVPDRGPVRIFLSLRRAPFVVLAAAILGVLTAWQGTAEAPLPTALADGSATIPMWRLLAVGAAVLPALALHSHLATLEQVATWRLRRYQRLYLGGICLACLIVYLGISALALHPLAIVIMARSWLAWLGLALVAGAVLGWRLAWTLPTFTAAILIYWGYRGDDGYAWWEFSARPHDDLPSLLLSLVLFMVGLVAYGLSAWRRRRLAFWRRRSRR